jgi:phosphohistidine phosphatase
MEVYLLRHGIAADQPPAGHGDGARALTDEGRRKMRAAARGMRALGITPDLLLSSPLVRAAETAQIVGDELGLQPVQAAQLAPGCTARRLEALLAQHSGMQRIMVVGHEPDLSTIVAALTGGSQVAMKKGTLAAVELPADSAFDGMLLWLLPPRVLRALAPH